MEYILLVEQGGGEEGDDPFFRAMPISANMGRTVSNIQILGSSLRH
jgi:hypothetical protein